MTYLDLRLSKILSEARLEQAESIRKRTRHDYERSYKQRLGKLLISLGGRLAKGEANIA